jgi:hypothetical protein
MAWAGSGIFTQTIADVLGQTAVMDLNTDSHKIALFNNSVVPDYDASAATVAFNTGTWTTGNEESGTGWASGGVVLATPTLTVADPGAGQLSWDAVDVSESTTTIAAFEGCFIYNDTIASPVVDQGLVAIDFTTPYSTTAGTLTITWDANGIFYLDLVP